MGTTDGAGNDITQVFGKGTTHNQVVVKLISGPVEPHARIEYKHRSMPHFAFEHLQTLDPAEAQTIGEIFLEASEAARVAIEEVKRKQYGKQVA